MPKVDPSQDHAPPPTLDYRKGSRGVRASDVFGALFAFLAVIVAFPTLVLGVWGVVAAFTEQYRADRVRDLRAAGAFLGIAFVSILACVRWSSGWRNRRKTDADWDG